MKLSIIVSFTCIILNVKLMNARPQVSEEQASVKAAVEAKDRALFAARTANKIVTEAGSQVGSNDLIVGALLANVARAASNAAEVAVRTASGDRFSAAQVADVFRQAAALAQIAESNVDALMRSVVEPGTQILSRLLSSGNGLTVGAQTQNSIGQLPDLKVGSLLRSVVEPGTQVLSGLLSRGNGLTAGAQTENSIGQLPDLKVGSLLKSVVEPGTQVLSGLLSRGNGSTVGAQTENSIALIPDLKVGSSLSSVVEPGTKALTGLLSLGNNVPVVGTGVGDSLGQIFNANVGSPIRPVVEPGTKNIFDLLSKVNSPVVEARVGDSVIRVPGSNVGNLIKSTVAGTNVLPGISSLTNVLNTRIEDGNSLASGSLTAAMRTIVEAAKRATIAASAVSDLTRVKTKAEAESIVAAAEQAAVDAENFAQQAGTNATTAAIIPGTEITSNITLLVANAFAAAARALAETAVTFAGRLRVLT